ncbi:site-specific integrase [Devosia sp. MC521]|uniref:site-specific integrase n=1 Tax=Devosia sp. MC521 TaxID=2759954 RepID=UPI0015FBFD40|nr:site-specific integrase [Devosia sp. MC521]MBJ6987079.1 site-specific integrase [Devosia sp. MC521]QMW62701.1 site-specific integrase [Devosia sp. MC521]
MGYLVRNLTFDQSAGRWKYRRVIPVALRQHIDRNITEFVRWLGAKEGTSKTPSASVLAACAQAVAECEALLSLARKRLLGEFDQLDTAAIRQVIKLLRNDLAEPSRRGALLKTLGVALHDTVEAVADLRKQMNSGDSLEHLRASVAALCERLGLMVDKDAECFQRLASRCLAVVLEVLDPVVEPRPVAVPIRAESPKKPAASVVRKVKQTITGLPEAWWREAEKAGLSGSTKEAYFRVTRQFRAFIGHDDAERVTAADVVAYKDHRLAQGTSLKTIKGTDISALRVLFGWAVSQQLLGHNPADGIKVMNAKRKVERSKGFTDEEARALLTASFNYQPSGWESPQVTAVRRWVPWLMAYTGARVGEVVQLRKEDIRQEGGHWVIRLTPEAGTIKTSVFRDVVLHPHLVELGFITFVQSRPFGHLFLKLLQKTDKAVHGGLETAKNRVREFVRTIITDERVQPNHAWRHRFETTARSLGRREDVTNAITGHATAGAAAGYGEVTLAAQVKFFEDWPRTLLLTCDEQ